MKHIYQEGDSRHPLLLLLHGTGGNEYDLLPIAEMIDKKASILSIRGQVLEQGMPRFFRRLTEGVFDEEDLVYRTNELNQFLQQAGNEHNFDNKHVIAVGYSNGANIAASLLFHHRDALHGAVLFHPMVPRRGITLPDLRGKEIFIAAGRRDPICLPKETEELKQLLENAGANVQVHWSNGGHQLTQDELTAAMSWYTKMFSRKDEA